MKKIILLASILLSVCLNTAYAGVVPGTIQVGTYTKSVDSCLPDTSGYTTASYWASTCESYCTDSRFVSKTCTWTCSGTGCIAPTWECGSNQCFASSTRPTGSWTLKYFWKNPWVFLFQDSSYNRILFDDKTQSCSAYRDSSTSWNVKQTASIAGYCGDGGAYWGGGQSGTCDLASSTDNKINSSSIQTDSTQTINTNRSSPSDTDASCTVQWRYATIDDTPPTVTTVSLAGVFDNDQDNWCNMQKYLGNDYGSSTNPELTGCTYYKSKASHANTTDKHPDLLEGLNITIDDPSGISAVTVEIGNCTANYSLATNVASIVSSSSSANGVKSDYRNITLNYNSTSTNGGSLPSLLTQFGKSRLDSCLADGKNYLKVTASDSARSNSDGIGYAPNTGKILDYSDSSKFIKVDNTVAKIGIFGDANKVAEANVDASCFIGSIQKQLADKQWKNYTVSGSLRAGDPFGPESSTCTPATCKNITSTGITCSVSSFKWGLAKPNVAGVGWTSPAGVNATTGQFTGYTCDSLGPIPDANACDWNCTDPNYTYNKTTNSCVKNSNLFILFDSGSVNVSGPFAAKLTSDPTTSHGLMKSKSASCTVPQNATASNKYMSFSFSAGANYKFNPTDTDTYPIQESSYGMCIPSCWQNYTSVPSSTNAGSCTANTQNGVCPQPQKDANNQIIQTGGTIITNTAWNTSQYFTQTWQGTGPNTGSWTPATAATAYDTNSGICKFQCASGTTWDSGTKSCTTTIVIQSCNNNGIQDNGEMGVDCGGGNCSACQAPVIQSCSNGAVNPPTCDVCPSNLVWDGTNCKAPVPVCAPESVQSKWISGQHFVNNEAIGEKNDIDSIMNSLGVYGSSNVIFVSAPASVIQFTTNNNGYFRFNGVNQWNSITLVRDADIVILAKWLCWSNNPWPDWNDCVPKTILKWGRDTQQLDIVAAGAKLDIATNTCVAQ